MENLISRLEAVTSRLEDIVAKKSENTPQSNSEPEMAGPTVTAFDDIVNGSLAKYLACSAKIGGDVGEHAKLVKSAFAAERDFIVKATQCQKPSDTQLTGFLQPVGNKIQEIQQFRESKRSSALFNHLSAISESIPALGWLAVSPAPGPYVKEMSDAGQFYTNRVLKDFKEKDPTHGDWVKSWLSTLTELQGYIKQHHTTGVQWNKQGSVASSKGSAPPPPGPPPPPVLDPVVSGGSKDDAKAALFAEISQGDKITGKLKKVSDDMKTHKNPALRTANTVPGGGPSAGGGTSRKSPPAKPSKLALDGKKWAVEYFTGKKDLMIQDTEMKQTVYVYRCTDCVITVKGKVNAITLDNCKKTALVFDEAISSVEFVNCQSVQAQVLHKVPTISIDKTDGCMVYLSKESLNSQIVSAKSSEMNILIPDASGDFKEFAIPEQFRSYWNGKKMITETSDSIG